MIRQITVTFLVIRAELHILYHQSERQLNGLCQRAKTDAGVDFVDRSTVISNKLVDELNNFLKFSHGTKLAVHAEKKNTPAGKRLAEMADILFVEEEPSSTCWRKRLLM